MDKSEVTYYWGTGRRKSSVARVRIKHGNGKIQINGTELNNYFSGVRNRNSVQSPLRVTKTIKKFDVFCNVNGGGTTGQAGAILMGLARALFKADPSLEKLLRDESLLTRDARMVERKKYGQKGARARFQFSKR